MYFSIRSSTELRVPVPFQPEALDDVNDRTRSGLDASPSLNLSPVDPGVLGALDRLDVGRHGFAHLRAGAHARADRTIAAVRLCRDAGQRGTSRIDPVRPVPGGLGPLLRLGADSRPLRSDEGAGGDDLHVR